MDMMILVGGGVIIVQSWLGSYYCKLTRPECWHNDSTVRAVARHGAGC